MTTTNCSASNVSRSDAQNGRRFEPQSQFLSLIPHKSSRNSFWARKSRCRCTQSSSSATLLSGCNPSWRHLVPGVASALGWRWRSHNPWWTQPKTSLTLDLGYPTSEAGLHIRRRWSCWPLDRSAGGVGWSGTWSSIKSRHKMNELLARLQSLT